MILTSTSEILQVVLSNTVATRQMDFYCSYNNITSTTLTPVKNQGTTNNSTVVTLIPSPGVSQQNQLKHLSIYNCDTSGNTVTIQLSGASGTRVLLRSFLFVGESIQFTPSNGWQSLTHNGIVKTYNTAQNPSPIKTPAYFSSVSGGLGATLTSGTAYAVYLGKADRPYNQVTILPNVTAVLGATITFAEAAIYKGYPTIGSNLTLTFCGFRECSGATQSGFGGTTITKTIPILVSGITTGDDIWVVISTVTSGTNLTIRAVNYDLLGSGFFQSATGSIRPSTATTISFTTVTTATRAPYIPWQGFQW